MWGPNPDRLATFLMRRVSPYLHKSELLLSACPPLLCQNCAGLAVLARLENCETEMERDFRQLLGDPRAYLLLKCSGTRPCVLQCYVVSRASSGE